MISNENQIVWFFFPLGKKTPVIYLTCSQAHKNSQQRPKLATLIRLQKINKLINNVSWNKLKIRTISNSSKPRNTNHLVLTVQQQSHLWNTACLYKEQFKHEHFKISIINILSLFTHTHIVPNPHDLILTQFINN